jgi:branched-chain amino acid transport system substrate-binding protein
MRGLRVLVAVMLVAAAACGARLSDDELLAARGRTGGANAQAAGSSATTSSVAGGTTAGGGGTVAGGGGQQAGGGGGQQAGGGGGDAASCAAEAGFSEVGVTDAKVTAGWVGTISGPVPGLSQTMQNGVKAYFDYVNSDGGVCGRELELVVADDRLDAGANRSETARLAQQVLGFVGAWSVVDDGGASVLQGTNIPDISLALGDARIALSNGFSTNPFPPNATSNNTTRMMEWFKQNYGVATAGIVYPAQAVARNSALRYENDMAAAGIQVTQKIEVAITQTDYNGVASQLKSANVDLVITTLENTGIANLAKAMDQQEFHPKVPFFGAQAYGRDVLGKGGAALEGTLLGIAYAIAEDAPQNEAMATLVEWYQRSNPGADLDFFAIEGWAAGAMFVQALRGAGAAPSRDKMLEQLKTFTSFDADGVIGTTNPAQKGPSDCFMIVTIEGGAWKRVYPSAGFDCG